MAVFRGYPSLQFGPPQTVKVTGEVEGLLIANRCAFELVLDRQDDMLSRWPVLVMPGCVALSDPQVRAIRSYVMAGAVTFTVPAIGVYEIAIVTF